VPDASGNVLYFLEDRIPESLRDLVRGYLDRSGFPYRECYYSEPQSAIAAHLEWAHAVLFAPGRYLGDELMASATNVRLMQLWSSGYDKFNVAGARKYGIPVANNGGANAISVAEHTMLLLLAVARRLPEAHVRATTGRWAGNSHGMDMVMLYGKTLSIIGMGNIGRQVARRAQAFGMKVLYHDVRRLDAAEEAADGATYRGLDDLLREADFLTLHLHLNASTSGIIGEREIALLKPGCVIVNVSRSQLIDLKALTPRLQQGLVLGAGFDVFDTEPTTGGEPYLALPNVVATPHTAGSTLDTYHMAMRNCMENISNALAGQPPQWVIN
jgi:phosphoglycerate dehydrogenase-like enzyme